MTIKMRLYPVWAITFLAAIFIASGGTAIAVPDSSSTDSASRSKTFEPVRPTSQQEAAAELSARFLTRFHYDAKPLDDAMSKKVFYEYLKTLDGSKMFFTQADLKHLRPDQTKLDDAIWHENLDVPFSIFNMYADSALTQYRYALGLLEKTFTFDSAETFNLSRKQAQWPKDKQALDALWINRVKNDWLRLKLAGDKDSQIRSVLKKRYRGYINRISQLDGEDAFQTFMDAYARTTDPHTDYFGPRRAENFAIAMRLSLEGIGAVLQKDGDYTQIRELVPGGPASKSGQLQAGDRIVGVGQGNDGTIENVMGWRLEEVVSKIRGKKGTTVRLEIIPAKGGLDGKHKVVKIVRDKVTMKEQAAKKKLLKVKGSDGQTYRIGVIDLPSFYEDFSAHKQGIADYKSASHDVALLIKDLKKEHVDGIVMDLRNNGGGSLGEAVRLTGLFIKKGPVVQVRQSNGSIHINSDNNPDIVWAGPLAVLVNRGAASASEIFTAAIKDYGRGVIIGEQTFGKGTVQSLVNLDQFSRKESKKPVFGEIKMTIAKFFRINGGSTQLRGVTPDIVFPDNGDKKEFGESSYDNALPWSQIEKADYQPVADNAALIPVLIKKHDERTKASPAWQLLVSELSMYRKNREHTVVSLNYSKRKERRDKLERMKKKFQQRHAQIKGDHHDAIQVRLDDGLQFDERSLKEQLEREKQAKEGDDVMLDEAANIVADEVELLQHQGKRWVSAILPYAGKYTPGYGEPALDGKSK